MLTVPASFTLAHGTYGPVHPSPTIDIALSVHEDGDLEGTPDLVALGEAINEPSVTIAHLADWTYRVFTRYGDRYGTLEIHAGAGA